MSTMRGALGIGPSPAPDTADRPLDWRTLGACTTEDPETFFHPEGERGRARQQRVEAAKNVCRHCPFTARCLEYAIATGQEYGVWGGLGEEERILLIRKHREGRRGVTTIHTPRETKPCQIDGCERPAHTAGNCYRHRGSKEIAS